MVCRQDSMVSSHDWQGDPPNTRETGRQTRAVLQIMLKKQHERYRIFVSRVAIGLIVMGMRALQLKLALAHSVMSDKKHECTCTLRLSLCLCWETALLNQLMLFLSSYIESWKAAEGYYCMFFGHSQK